MRLSLLLSKFAVTGLAISAMATATAQAQGPAAAPVVAPHPAGMQPAVLLAAQAAASTTQTAGALSSQDVHAAAKAYVYRLTTNLEHASSQALHGTAFVIDTSGYLVTNFHVVQEFLFSDGKMKLLLEIPSGSIPANVVAVDPVNDLALVQVSHAFPGALPIAAVNNTREGELVYSLGFPANDQLTFAQGNYGGEKLSGFVTAGFATLPLNGGMSGGPMLNAQAEVIGVNRAMIKGAQNLSLFSPLQALKEVAAKRGGRTLASDSAGWRKEVTSSIRRQEKLTSVVNNTTLKRERLGNVSFVLPLPNQKCGQGKDAGSDMLSAEMLYCQTGGLTPLKGTSNALEVLTVGLESANAAFQLKNVVGVLLKRRYETEATNIIVDKLEGAKKKRGLASLKKLLKAGDEKCSLQNVRNAQNVDMTVSYCSLANQFFQGLHSTFVQIEVHGGQDSKVFLGQVYQGLSADTTADILQRFLDSVQLESGK